QRQWSDVNQAVAGETDLKSTKGRLQQRPGALLTRAQRAAPQDFPRDLVRQGLGWPSGETWGVGTSRHRWPTGRIVYLERVSMDEGRQLLGWYRLAAFASRFCAR